MVYECLSSAYGCVYDYMQSDDDTMPSTTSKEKVSYTPLSPCHLDKHKIITGDQKKTNVPTDPRILKIYDHEGKLHTRERILEFEANEKKNKNDNPLLFQLHCRRYLEELKHKHELETLPSLKDVSDDFLDELNFLGFNVLYLLGVWQTGEAGKKISEKQFPKGTKGVCSSPFAITEYKIHQEYGGEEALLDLRARLKARNIKLFLDFVPNHVALDHVWVSSRPELLMQGTPDLLKEQPQNFFRDEKSGTIFAHGRDPYFPGWNDTVQLNYFKDETREEMIKVINYIETLCDGIRCDMAMLICKEIFNKTWSYTQETLNEDFWVITINQMKKINPDFIFMAEVYWDYEYHLQQQGFNFTYDKRLLDRLKSNQDIAGHLNADYDFQLKSVRFLENHDEQRAATTFQNFDQHKAAAVICFTVPGLKFIYEGQMEGRKVQLNNHLDIRAEEETNENIFSFYHNLLVHFLKDPQIRKGNVVRVKPSPADFNYSTCDNIISHYIISTNDIDNEIDLFLVVVNYSDESSEGFISALPLPIYDTIKNRQRITLGSIRSPTSSMSTSSSSSSYSQANLSSAAPKKPQFLLMDILSNTVFKRNFVDDKRGIWFGLTPHQSYIFRIVPC